jgi:hypothetical protein
MFFELLIVELLYIVIKLLIKTGTIQAKTGNRTSKAKCFLKYEYQSKNLIRQIVLNATFDLIYSVCISPNKYGIGSSNALRVNVQN